MRGWRVSGTPRLWSREASPLPASAPHTPGRGAAIQTLTLFYRRGLLCGTGCEGKISSEGCCLVTSGH
jgi:hypothetical protein